MILSKIASETGSKLFLSAFCLLLSIPATAQTKRIAHYSHGGSDAGFRAGGEDNFGIVYRPGRPVYVAPPPPDTSRRMLQVHRQVPVRLQVTRRVPGPAVTARPATVVSREQVRPQVGGPGRIAVPVDTQKGPRAQRVLPHPQVQPVYQQDQRRQPVQ